MIALSKAVKLKNDNYLDSTSIVHNNKKLSDILHPVGEVYMTTNKNFNPNTVWGGTWEKLSHDAYLKIETNKIGVTGGTTGNHTIPLSSIPSHNHILSKLTFGAGGIADDGLTIQRGYYGSGGGNAAELLPSNYEISSSGDGQAYYPYYYGVIAWHRTA